MPVRLHGLIPDRAWRLDRAVVVSNQFFEPLDYPVSRPAAVLRDAGLEVHAVAQGKRAREEREGITVWHEPSQPAMAARVTRLRAGLLFVESTTYAQPWVVLARSAWMRNPTVGAGRARAALARWGTRKADVVSFTNPHAAQAWSGLTGHRRDLSYPVDVAWWAEPVDRDEGWWTSRDLSAPPGPVVTYVANLLRRKRQIELVQALVPLLQRRRDLTVVLAGGTVEPDVEAELRRIRSDAGVEHQVLLPGWLPPTDIRSLFAWSTAQVVESAFETQCMAVYEALAAGVPTLISDIPELTSAFPALPAHRDPTALAVNLEGVLADPAGAAEQVAASMSRVWWADVAAHDRLLLDTAGELLGRPLSVPAAPPLRR